MRRAALALAALASRAFAGYEPLSLANPWTLLETRRRVLDTSNEAKRQKRLQQGFEHVLHSHECRLRLFGEGGVHAAYESLSLVHRARLPFPTLPSSAIGSTARASPS